MTEQKKGSMSAKISMSTISKKVNGKLGKVIVPDIMKTKQPSEQKEEIQKAFAKKQKIHADTVLRITIDSELVTLWFGNVPIECHYEDGIRIGHYIISRCKEAKRLVGDTSREILTNASLTNAELPRKIRMQ